LGAGELLSWHKFLIDSLNGIEMKTFILSLVAVFFSTLLLAQEETKKINVDINTDGGGSAWYTSPWLWVVAAAIFILLLVALTRGGRRD
jgi:hypothetical protein